MTDFETLTSYQRNLVLIAKHTKKDVVVAKEDYDFFVDKLEDKIHSVMMELTVKDASELLDVSVEDCLRIWEKYEQKSLKNNKEAMSSFREEFLKEIENG